MGSNVVANVYFASYRDNTAVIDQKPGTAFKAPDALAKLEWVKSAVSGIIGRCSGHSGGRSKGTEEG